MDTNVRSLLSSAQAYKGVEKNPHLQQAYVQLRCVAESRPAVDAPDPFGQDLYVLCAETAFQYGHNEIARDCLKMFFMKQQPANQFLIRAYLCQAQLLAPQNANNPEQLDKAVVYMLKAISMAKKTQRYHFLVYNASVLYWQFCRPFLKPNYRQYLARSLHQVVKALDDIEDTDCEWRAQLMIALIECHLDAGRRNDASHIATAAASFIKQNVPHLYKQVFGLMVRNQLVESSKLHKDVKTSPELSVFYKICKLKNSMEQEEPREYYMDISAILTQIGVTRPSGSTSQSMERLSRKDSKNVSGRRSPSAHSVSPTGEETTGGTGGTTSRKSASKTGRRTPTPTTSKKLTSDSADSMEDEDIERPLLLQELAHLCLELGFSDLAADCVEHMKTCNAKDQGFYLQVEFLQCMLMVKNLGEKQESYQKPVVDLRLQAIKRCEEAIMNAIRFGDPNVIQAGCVTQWNLCLPLTQPNLRRLIRKPLTLIAEALEDIQSLLIQLRCQVHTELARCEEDLEQIQVAMEHLKKALKLDDGNVYQERLEVMLRRLELRSQLYRQPERPEDQAAMIIEQARKADSGTIRMKRSLLVKAGEALAPDAFLLVLDSESDTKANSQLEEDEASGRGPLTMIKQLGGKARAFNRCVRKAEGHLKRLGDENDRERARLWADLAKTARKQEVWDVCRVAARFCILYDDGRWKNVAPKPDTPKAERSKTDIKEESEEKKGGSRIGSRPLTPVEGVPLYDKDLIRMLAEVNFINGEALVHLLRGEGVQLNDKPIPPEDKSKRPKGYVAKKPEDDPDWIEYCDWIAELSEASTKAFLRGMELGVELAEAWLVCCAATYIWNYNNHILSSNRHREIVPALTTLLTGLKKVGHAGETVLLVNICKALAYGLLVPWIPQPPKEEKPEPASVAAGASPRSKGGKSAPSSNKAKPNGVIISPDAGPDIKKAIEVCEFAMGTTAGDNPQDVVPVAVRQPLLQIWVTAKQMGQQQISKTLGTDDDSSTDGQKPMTRAIVATEMLSVNKNGIMEFKDAPFIGDVAQMVEKSTWSDHFIELQMWVRLTYLAFELGGLHNLVMRCSGKALKFAAHGTQARARRKDKHQHMVEQEMLSYASVLQGQSLILNMAGKNSMRREAMEAFLNSCRFACAAGNYELVMSASRHYWNAAIPLVSQPIERELLKEPLKIILDCIAATSDKKVKKEEPPPAEEPPAEEAAKEEEEGKEEGGDSKKVVLLPKPKPPAGMIGKPNEDLTLRAAMYGVLFQSYADNGEWEQALQAMDQAVTDMPRTKHRLLVFKHRVMVKAKLGRSVHMDIQKFKDESEDYVAHMWRRVALSSKELCEQLSSYQNAIESLNSPSNEFQKAEYLLEFGQWLYSNEFPLQDVLDQVEWAIDILLKMHDNQAAALKKDVAGKGSTTSVDGKKGAKGKKMEKKRSKGSARSKASSIGQSKSPGADGRLKKVISDTKSEISDQDSEINAADYVPVVKESVIGVLPNNPSLTINDLTDIRQLDALVRAHVLLAELTGRDGACYADILLQAYGYLLRLWKALMAEAGPAMKEIAKNQATQAEAAPKGKASGKGKGTGKEKDATPVKEKPKRKGPLEALPDFVEDWAVYDAPDEAVEAFQSEVMKKTGLNETTLPKPMLTLYYLTSLTGQLKQLGYSHLTLPIMAFEDVLSRSMLKNHSLNVLVHLKALEVCQELDLKQGTEFHEGVIGPVRIREEDQAVSRQEIALWKEKQVQVAREEMRVKETLARMTMESGSKSKKSATELTNKTSKTEDESTVGHIGVKLGAVSLRVVWTDIAEVLLRLGYLQRAREFLNEANIAAKAFADTALHARIMLLLGKLSFEEAQYGQAINFCKKAQDIHEGDEMFWFETTVLLVDAILHDDSSRRRKRAAKKIIVQALNEFQQITNDRPNRAAVIGFIMTTLEARLAGIQMDSVLEHHSDINLPKVMKSVLTVCEKVDDAAERLVRLGHRREAVPLVLKHAKHLTELARAATETSIQHAYYLEALGVLGEAESLAEQTFFDVQTLTILHETRSVNLAVQRELCEIQLRRGELLTEVSTVQVREMRALQLVEQRKGSIQRLVEDYIQQTPSHSPAQRAWLNNRACLFEEAGSALLSAHSLAGSRTDLRARALSCLGKCLRILAEHKGPDPPPQWLVHEMEMLRMQAEAEEAEAEEAEKEKEKEKQAGGEEGGGEGAEGEKEEEEGKKEMTEEEQKLWNKQAAIIDTMAHQHEQSKLYFTYATECLSQALNLALANKHVAVASEAALELVKCCGQFDPSAASQFLVLFQSCQTALRLEAILHQAQRDPMTSRLAALLHQRQSLMRNHLTSNLGLSSQSTTVTHSLEKDWQAWKLLEVLPNHMDLLKEFPPNFNFVILQHSPDKDFLFGAVLDKPKATGGEKGKGNPKLAAASSNRAKIFGSETSGHQLQEIQSKWHQHKQSVQAFLLKQEYQRTQAAQRQKMLENLDDTKKLPKMLMDGTADEEQMLEEEFRELVAAMENYLKPVMAAIDTALRATYSPLGSTGNVAKDSHKDKDKDKDAGNECVILLADADLLELPLEALSCLQADGIASLSRDFSLQFLYHRMHQGIQLETQTQSAAPKAKAGKKGDKKENAGDKKKAKDAAAVMSRIPGARDIKAKQAKIIPLSRPVQPWQQNIDTMNFRYIVDPNLDCSETEERLPVELFNKVLDEYEQQFTPRWLGVLGTDHAPSVGEWEVYITESSSFIFYGLERLLSYLPPAKMSALNIPDCMLVYSLDLAQTSKSFMRQSKEDVFKNVEDHSLEKPLETAMLVSLSGVRCFMTNQWYCTLAENANKLSFNMKDLLEKGKTTGQSVRLLFNPRKRREEEKTKEADDPPSHREEPHKEKDKDGKGKKDDSSSEKSKKDDHHGKKGDDASKADTGSEKRGSVFAESMQGDGMGSERDDPDKDLEEPKEEDLSVMRRSWFNMVCYGMPNLIVTQ